MLFIGSSDEAVIGNIHDRADVLDLTCDLVNVLLRGDTLRLCKLLDLETVLVRSCEEEYVIALHTLETCHSIGKDHLIGIADMRLL